MSIQNANRQLRFRSRAKKAGWYARNLLSHGVPRKVVYFGEALGDDLLCTAIFREARKRFETGLWMLSEHKQLFFQNPDVAAVLPYDRRYRDLCRRLGVPFIIPHYTVRDWQLDTDVPPSEHIISIMCARAGVSGTISLRPYFFLSDSEFQAGRLLTKQVVISNTGRSAIHFMANKEWYPDRFQEVVSRLKGKFNFVQVGSLKDPAIEGALDLRGKTSVRQMAAILANSIGFLGLVGFLMHLARSVDCRSVIIYGGREFPWQSGYICNENLYSQLDCSPCWRWNTCDHDRECMNRITVKGVIEALLRLESRSGEPLETEERII